MSWAKSAGSTTDRFQRQTLENETPIKNASGPDIHTAYTVLEQACARDPACGCTLLGDALTMNERHDERGLALLDVACVRGALTACDITDMLAELCSREPTGSACALLRRQARVAPPEPPLPAWPERAP